MEAAKQSDGSDRSDGSDKKLTGTREWSAATINIQMGCEHNCRYCYARYDAVTRRKRCTREGWRQPRIHPDRVDARYRRLPGPVMFPSTHDITPANISECLVVIKKLLEAGNELLIVSKPHLGCVQLLCEVLKRWQRHIMFRFTIGSVADKVLAFWEPGAPNFDSRIKSLTFAYFAGYRTSVSCEPYLDGFPQHVYDACRDYIVDSFWIGKLRNWASRVDLSGATDEEVKLYVEPLKAVQGDGFVRGLVRMLDGRKFIRWKDSIREVIEKEPQINADKRRRKEAKYGTQELHQPGRGKSLDNLD